jgi:hypothetical protein
MTAPAEAYDEESSRSQGGTPRKVTSGPYMGP